MGNLCKDLEDLEGAIKLSDKSIEIKKDNIHAYNNKAEIFLLQKKDFPLNKR